MVDKIKNNCSKASNYKKQNRANKSFYGNLVQSS